MSPAAAAGAACAPLEQPSNKPISHLKEHVWQKRAHTYLLSIAGDIGGLPRLVVEAAHLRVCENTVVQALQLKVWDFMFLLLVDG